VSNIAQISIINTDDKFKINMCLTSMDTGEELLNESWTGQHNNQRKISANLLSKMADVFNVELSEDLKQLFETEHDIDNIAYKKYLEGKFLSDNMSHGGDLNKSEKLLEEAIKIDDEFSEAYSALAMTKNLLGNYEDAEESLETAIDLAEDSQNESALMIIYNNSGIYYKERQKYKKSIRYFEKGIKLLRIYQDDLMEAKFLHNMAGSYGRLGDNDRALDFLYKAQKIYKKLELSLGNSYGEIGVRYKDINKHEEAITSFNRAIRIFKSEGKSFNVARVLIMQSDIYNSIGEFHESIKVLDNAVLIAEDFHDELMDGRIMSSYAMVYYHQKKYNEAIESLFNAISHFQNMNRNNLVLDSMMKLIQLYIETNDIESAKSMYEKSKKLSRRVNDPVILSGLDKLEENIKSLQ
jgi:tetratricopeptide (TPR) repeat protein